MRPIAMNRSAGPGRGGRPALAVVTLVAAASAMACLSGPDRSGGNGRLDARPHAPAGSLAPGVHRLGLASGRDGFLYVPAGQVAGRPAPLAVLLHGAGGRADNWGGVFPLADSLGLVLLVPDSRGSTWDLVRGGFGGDVDFIDDALDRVFDRVAVDPTRIAVAGFSDGASYALSLGLTNGDLFTHVVAFSPGFMRPASRHGSPRIYVSHGTQDTVLPIASTSRVIVPQLEQAGYSVVYEEFDGPHQVPRAIVDRALGWATGG